MVVWLVNEPNMPTKFAASHDLPTISSALHEGDPYASGSQIIMGLECYNNCKLCCDVKEA